MIRVRSVEDEYEKNKDIKREDIQKLREWVNSQPHLPSQYITDLDLFLAYHSCEKSAEVSKQVLDLHYTLKTQIPLLKDLVYDESIQKSMNVLLTTLLPATTKEGYKILFISLLDGDFKKFSLTAFLRQMVMMLDIWQNMEGCWPGFVMVVNVQKASMGHITKMEVNVIQQIVYFLQEALYVKLKAVHYINTAPIIDKVLMIIKPFLKEGLIHKVVAHESCSFGDDDIVAALPKEVGGEWKSLSELRDEALALVEANQDFFKTLTLKKIDETKRPGRQKTISDFFGSVEGSFKNLEID